MHARPVHRAAAAALQPAVPGLAADRATPADLVAVAGPAHGLRRGERRLDVEEAQPGHPPRSGLDRVVDPAPEHLVAGADPEDGRPGADHGVGQAPLTDPGEVGDGRPTAREHDQVSVVEVVGASGPAQAHRRLHHEGVEVGGVGQVRQPDDRHPHGRGRAGRAGGRRQVEAVLEAEHRVLAEVREDAEHRQAGASGQLGVTGLQQGGVAAEPVEDEAAHLTTQVVRQQRPGPVRRGEGPAAVDVDHHDGRHPRRGREGEVDQVTVQQVDLRGSARALRDHPVVLGPKGRERLENHVTQTPRRLAVRRGVRRPDLVTEDHEVAGPGRGGLEEDRVHPAVRGHPCRPRLHGLGASDLTPVVGDRGVVGHVLGLERRDVSTRVGPDPAQGGGDGGLAGTTGGTADQQRAAQ